MYTHSKQFVKSGLPVNEAKKVIILLHGRGATAESILSLADHLSLSDAAVFAPQATNHSWYPHSFLAPVEKNQPALDSALEVIDELVKDLQSKGISLSDIYFLGFSQGACLTLEYVTRNAANYGGIIAFTGGLIGETLNAANYKGDFQKTPVLLTTGDPDPHVPVTRVEETVSVLEGMNAEVIFKVYKGRPHTITEQEIDLANQKILAKATD